MSNERHNDNLRSLSDVSAEERKKIASLGGHKSTEVRRRKKMMSEVYSKVLAHRYNIDVDGEMKKMSGERMLVEIIGSILLRRDSASVAMQKEIREALEGSQVELSGELKTNYSSELKNLSDDELKQLLDLTKKAENEA